MLMLQLLPFMGKWSKREHLFYVVDNVILHAAQLFICSKHVQPKNTNNDPHSGEQDAFVIPCEGNYRKQRHINGNEQPIRIIALFRVTIGLLYTSLPLFQNGRLVTIAIFFFFHGF